MFEIEEFTEAPRPVIAGIIGRPGDGKTLSSLKLAVGAAGSASAVLFIDNEGGRGREYAGMPEFRGIRYAGVPYNTTSNQYNEFITKSVLPNPAIKAVVFDSGSNEYQSILAYADAEERRLAAANSKRGQNVWKAPKAAHKRFRDSLLFSGKHIFITYLLTEKLEEANSRNQRYIEAVQCEKNDPKEFDFMLDISRDQRSLEYAIVKDSQWFKCFQKYRDIVFPGVELNSELGSMMATATMKGSESSSNVNGSDLAIKNVIESAESLPSLESFYAGLTESQRLTHRTTYDRVVGEFGSAPDNEASELPEMHHAPVDLDAMREDARQILIEASQGGIKPLGLAWVNLRDTHKPVINDLVSYKDNLKQQLES